MGFLAKNWETGGFGLGVCRKLFTFFFCFSLTISMGCSVLSSSKYLLVQSDDYLLHEVDRDGWVTTNQGFGSVRPPVMSINVAGEGELMIYPVCIGGNLEMFGPPLLSLIWIPRFMHLPPRHPLNTLHFVYSGWSGDMRIESINDVLINQESVKKEEHKREMHYYLTISDSIHERGILEVKVFIAGETINLIFNRTRSVNYFPLFVPL